MRENMALAVKRRTRPLPAKYLACDPLPSPYDERDLTSFITQWRETPDTELRQAIDNCQIAENVVKEMQNLQGEALAEYDGTQLRWCQHYVDELRSITAEKFDQICAHVLMYMEKHTRLSDEEIERVKESGKTRGKGDITQKV